VRLPAFRQPKPLAAATRSSKSEGDPPRHIFTEKNRFSCQKSKKGSIIRFERLEREVS
jgi:hypothetical protein